MAVFQSFYQTHGNPEEDGAKGIEILKQAGVILPPNFKCFGMPWICYEDFTKNEGEAFDLAIFKGRIILGGNMNSSDLSSFPAGACRLTIGKMSDAPGDFGRITVGKTDLNSTNILSFASVTIGDNVHLDPRVVIQDCDGHQSDRRLPDTVENKKRAPVVIEDNVWIGYGSTILKGVTVGHHAVIMPGSVVMWSVPPYGTVMGNPAKSAKIYQKYMDAK